MRIRIHIPTILFKHLYLEIVKNTLNSIIKKNISTIWHFLLNTAVLQYTGSRIRRETTFLFICSFIFCWIRIRNNNSGSRFRQKFRIQNFAYSGHYLLDTRTLTLTRYVKIILSNRLFTPTGI